MARPIPDDRVEDARQKMMAHQAEESGKRYSPVPPLNREAWMHRLVLEARLWIVILAIAVVFVVMYFGFLLFKH